MHKSFSHTFIMYGVHIYIGTISFLSLLVPLTNEVMVYEPPTFVNVCHSGSILNLDSNALSGHLGHGDVQLIDNDGDGYYTDISSCSSLVDCDDTDPSITTCVTAAVGSPHPTFGGIVFEIDGQGGGKLVNCTPVYGLNFGYVDIQHEVPWTTSTSDGFANTAALYAVYPNFDPIRVSTMRGPEWYLPSIDELEEIYKIVYAPGIALNDGIYLSSTDAGNSRIRAYYFHLTNARYLEYSHYGNGAYTLSVRAF